jgi:hypothetical protein
VLQSRWIILYTISQNTTTFIITPSDDGAIIIEGESIIGKVCTLLYVPSNTNNLSVGSYHRIVYISQYMKNQIHVSAFTRGRNMMERTIKYTPFPILATQRG